MSKSKLTLPSHVFSYQGQGRGPTVVVMGGVHGDELTGILVAKKLKSLVEKNKLVIQNGQLIIVTAGNPKAVARGTRGSKPGTDLNRCFRGDFLKSSNDKSYEITRARALAPVLAPADVCLDLHATRKPAEPFITWGSAGLDKHRRELCKCFGASRLLLDQKLIYTGPAGGCADDFVNRSGGIGICYETGQTTDTSRASAVLQEVINCLRFLKILSSRTLAHHPSSQRGGVGRLRRPGAVSPPSRTVAQTLSSAEERVGRGLAKTQFHHRREAGSRCGGDKPPQVFKYQQAIILTAAGFTYAGKMGAYNFQPVKKGVVIGYHGKAPLIAKSNCVIVFPKTKDLWQVGKAVGYLAVPVV